ncbi:aldo/keto reductase [Synoicihabitans lomoniglobus]|uniref:Aldo/keto reductase n=1 Tax=Synoicihabitans lomoniglobus TaxID=2909285 RepID=A0AAE9ZT65_9BACT|nr:aldo/keto reductase [Opitutaceae bacterium LMO-M01]WED63672.1 aldo/keto reductase [Opitutaceae bacterium LMO-M01]
MTLNLGPICLGTSTFGREIDARAACGLMDHASACGITLFDTAATYSEGAAEEIVGRWLRHHRNDARRPMIATKIYPPYTPAAMSAAVAASAHRLGVETIDLLYLHKWDPTIDHPDALTALDQLIRSNRVRHLGLSNFSADQLVTTLRRQAAQGLTPAAALQNNHNLAVREMTAEHHELCRNHQITPVTYSPLGAGYLTGKHRTGVAAGSRFDISPGHREVYFTPAAARRLAGLEAIAARSGYTMTHLALAWALHQPGNTSVLIGGRHADHIDQAFRALAFHDADLFAELDAL